jgi:cell division protein FtsA
MASFERNLLTAIDIGSAKTCALVAELTDNGPRYCGHGVSDARGSRKGAIVDLDKAAVSVQRAVEQAEHRVGAPVERALVGIAGPHVRGVNSRGGVSLGSRPREIGREEIRAAFERARAFNMPEDRQTLHLLPQQFILDEQDGIRDPDGMVGTRLEAQVHVVTASATAAQTIVTALNRAGIHVDDTIYEPLAAADALLRPDERELGVCLVDIGAGSTDLVVYYEGAVANTGAVPIGGDHFTNDVAVGLRTPLADAEKIKRSFGCAVVTKIPETNEIEVPSIADKPSRLMPQRFLCEVLQARAQELFEHVREHLRHAGVLELCGAGVVLTGGGARLSAIAETAEQVLRQPVRLPLPAPLDKMPAELAAPEFATAIGMIFYGNRVHQARSAQEQGFTAKLRSLFSKRTSWSGTNAVTSDRG